MIDITMRTFLDNHPALKDVLGIIGFVLAVVIGAALINQFLFRSFSVSGPSMEPTLYTGNRLIVNRIPVTLKLLQGQPYIPQRGEVIVFRNPLWLPSSPDEYIVKRVIGFPGERVVVKDGEIRVFNADNPGGLDVDALYPGATSPTYGDVDTVVPENELFVAGDHRQQGFSLDSRDGLGTVPYEDLIGPVTLRIYPFTEFRTF